jgi:multidrug efflux system membrane fusion protein
VVINQIQPVNVTFNLPEKYLPEIRKYMTIGKLTVEALLSADDKSPSKGALGFIDNAVDASTGTIIMKASFSNQDRRLWPGQFVNVIITLAIQQDVTVVPAGTVQTGQQGQYVYVVKGDVAELRPVTAGTDYQGLTVIEKGLEPGEQVVTDGQMRLKPGARVVIKQSQTAKSEEQGAKNIGQNQQPEVLTKDKSK